MATILVKGVPEELLRELKRLKVELNCKTWAELLEKLTEAKGAVLLSNEDSEKMKRGLKGFLSLSEEVSRKWTGAPSVLEELRKSRHHGRR